MRTVPVIRSAVGEDFAMQAASIKPAAQTLFLASNAIPHHVPHKTVSAGSSDLVQTSQADAQTRLVISFHPMRRWQQFGRCGIPTPPLRFFCRTQLSRNGVV
jgi:hypothetical protein